jgi:divalent metal cation (Fe/Co/Zn/Cd) transporter
MNKPGQSLIAPGFDHPTNVLDLIAAVVTTIIVSILGKLADITHYYGHETLMIIPFSYPTDSIHPR